VGHDCTHICFCFYHYRLTRTHLHDSYSISSGWTSLRLRLRLRLLGGMVYGMVAHEMSQSPPQITFGVQHVVTPTLVL
jgi:hypothetical protein